MVAKSNEKRKRLDESLSKDLWDELMGKPKKNITIDMSKIRVSSSGQIQPATKKK